MRQQVPPPTPRCPPPPSKGDNTQGSRLRLDLSACAYHGFVARRHVGMDRQLRGDTDGNGQRLLETARHHGTNEPEVGEGV